MKLFITWTFGKRSCFAKSRKQDGCYLVLLKIQYRSSHLQLTDMKQFQSVEPAESSEFVASAESVCASADSAFYKQPWSNRVFSKTNILIKISNYSAIDCTNRSGNKKWS